MYTGIKTGFLTRLLFFQLLIFFFASSFSVSVLLFHDFPQPTLQFHDFPGLEMKLQNSMTFQVFHDPYES